MAKLKCGEILSHASYMNMAITSPRVLFRTVLLFSMGHSTLISSVKPSKSNHGMQTVPGATWPWAWP